MYNTSVCECVNEKGSLYFFSAAILSVEASCLVEEVDRRTTSSIRRQFPLLGQQSGSLSNFYANPDLPIRLNKVKEDRCS